jgi:hypothetical protein
VKKNLTIGKGEKIFTAKKSEPPWLKPWFLLLQCRHSSSS